MRLIGTAAACFAALRAASAAAPDGVAAPINFSLPPEQMASAIFLWQLIGVGMFVLGAVYTVVNIWDKLRRKPPAEDHFATKGELGDVEKRLGSAIRDLKQGSESSEERIHSRVDAVAKTVETSFASVERALGRLEGSQFAAQKIADAIEEGFTRATRNLPVKT